MKEIIIRGAITGPYRKSRTARKIATVILLVVLVRVVLYVISEAQL